MRFISPQANETRIRTKFAILPIVINGESRWLERVCIEETYVWGGESGWQWLPTKFDPDPSRS